MGERSCLSSLGLSGELLSRLAQEAGIQHGLPGSDGSRLLSKLSVMANPSSRVPGDQIKGIQTGR